MSEAIRHHNGARHDIPTFASGDLRGNGIHYLDTSKLEVLRRADIALDKDGVFTKDPKLLNFCRYIGFEMFGGKFTAQERVKGGLIYTINEDIGATLGTIRGYNTGSAPVEAIIAVNRLAMEEKPEIPGISLKGMKPDEIFATILSLNNSADILDTLRMGKLNDSDRALAQEMFSWYHEKIYKHPDMARLMLEIPGSKDTLMELSRHCRDNGKRLSVVTDTPDQETFVRHLAAVGFDAAARSEFMSDLKLVTQKDVTQRKPHPEGLLSVKRPDKHVLYVGDTGRDGAAAQRAKLITPDVDFVAVLSGGTRVEAFKEFKPILVAKDITAAAAPILRAN